MLKSLALKFVGLGATAVLAAAVIPSLASAYYVVPCSQSGRAQIWESTTNVVAWGRVFPYTTLSGRCFPADATVGFYMWRVDGVDLNSSYPNGLWWVNASVTTAGDGTFSGVPVQYAPSLPVASSEGIMALYGVADALSSNWIVFTIPAS
jgi:hypothetical protein